MIVENAALSRFSKFNKFNKLSCVRSKAKPEEKINIKPILGATIGTIGAMILTKKTFASKSEAGVIKALEMITMATGANLGGVIGGSLDLKKAERKEGIRNKFKEAGFQIMNMSFPMALVTFALETCKKIKALNNKTAKIIGSILGMTTGAFLATQITNLTQKDEEKERKYTIKDSIANFDDIIATIKIGFPAVDKKISVSKILPFIYIYSGSRAGSKE